MEKNLKNSKFSRDPYLALLNHHPEFHVNQSILDAVFSRNRARAGLPTRGCEKTIILVSIFYGGFMSRIIL